jgi:hypothetical protein
MHDGKGSLEFLEELFVQFHDTLKHRQVLEMRMDGAFFREDVLVFPKYPLVLNVCMA